MSSPQCAALAKALASKGYDTAQLANKAGLSAGRVEGILSGSAKPTKEEFGAIAAALDLSSAPKHAAEVAV